MTYPTALLSVSGARSIVNRLSSILLDRADIAGGRFQTQNPKPNTQNFGFTMIELLISIAVLGILAAVTIPQLSGIYANQQVINTANELVSNIKVAQNRALANDQEPAQSGINRADCDSTHKYIDQWGVEFLSDTQYRLYMNFREVSKLDGSNCLGKDTTQSAQSYNVPSTVKLGTAANNYIEYNSTSGQPRSGGLLGSNAGIRVYSTRTNLEYYVCVDTARRAYAQTTTCP